MDDSVYLQIVGHATEIAKHLDPDPGHAIHVAQLALKLFDQLNELHKLATHDRQLLELAAVLHDIGLSDGGAAKHHKRSMDMILAAEIPDLDSTDRLLCALVARFHRKAEPTIRKHEEFAKLPEDQQKSVEWLAGLLRVADGLDRGHVDRVKDLTCTIKEKKVIITVSCDSDCELEIWGAYRKAELLQRKLHRKLVITSCE